MGKILIKIDLRDKRILFHLLDDSRQSLKTIGKKVGISRELASFRIRRLIEKKIISNFTVIINEEKLGYSLLNIYYKFANISPNVKDEIINFFINNELTRYVSSLEGIYDFQVEFLMGEPFEFEELLDKIKSKYHNYLSIESAEAWIRGEDYCYPFLLDETITKIEPVHWNWGHSLVKIDELDFYILLELAEDSRIPTIKLANKLKSTVTIINYRIKKLIKQGIIVKFTINVDWSIIGYRWFHLRINLSDYEKKDKIIQHLRQNPHLIRILKGIIHKVDIHCTFLLQNMEQLRKITEDISYNFPGVITNYQFYSTFKLYKFHYMVPKLLNFKNPLNKGRNY